MTPTEFDSHPDCGWCNLQRSKSRYATESLERFKARLGQIVEYVEWMADQPCSRPDKIKTLFKTTYVACAVSAKGDASWMCPQCKARTMRFGT